MVLDLLTVVGPLMTSPLLYPLLTGLSSLDGVLPMVPSEAAVLTAGVFAHSGTPNLWVVVVATALGVFAGDHLAYGLSRTVFGPRLISRSKHVSQAVGAASRQLDRRAGLLIVTSRFLPGGRVTMNAACGTARLPLSRFSPASAVAALAWAAYMAGIGFLGGAAFVENPLLALAVGIGLSFGVGSIVELIRRRVGRVASGRAAPSSERSGRRDTSQPLDGSGSASHASKRPRDQQRPMAAARRVEWSNAARPMMLWPEARRSPKVGIAGATPTPSADTHATVRPVAASSRRYRKRRRLSRGNRDRAHVVVTTGIASTGTLANASGSTSTASPRSSSGWPVVANASSASSLASCSG
jgi:membrane protein DedA with SNARE-associated domain